MIRSASRLAALMLLAGLLAACDHSLAPPPNALTDADDGKQIQLTVGDPLTLWLTSNHSTGYQWTLMQDADPVLEQAAEPDYQVKPNSGGGAGGKETWRFKAAAPGEQTLKLGYHRPFEKEAAPIETYTLDVTVTE